MLRLSNFLDFFPRFFFLDFFLRKPKNLGNFEILKSKKKGMRQRVTGRRLPTKGYGQATADKGLHAGS